MQDVDDGSSAALGEPEGRGHGGPMAPRPCGLLTSLGARLVAGCAAQGARRRAKGSGRIGQGTRRWTWVESLDFACDKPQHFYSHFCRFNAGCYPRSCKRCLWGAERDTEALLRILATAIDGSRLGLPGLRTRAAPARPTFGPRSAVLGTPRRAFRVGVSQGAAPGCPARSATPGREIDFNPPGTARTAPGRGAAWRLLAHRAAATRPRLRRKHRR